VYRDERSLLPSFMPTKNEAFGLVYQEAAAAGLPAIGSRLNAVPEIIDDGKTGILVTPGSQGELMSAMQTMIGYPELRSQMGDAARRKIEHDADAEAHREKLVGLIMQLSAHHA